MALSGRREAFAYDESAFRIRGSVADKERWSGALPQRVSRVEEARYFGKGNREERRYDLPGCQCHSGADELAVMLRYPAETGKDISLFGSVQHLIFSTIVLFLTHKRDIYYVLPVTGNQVEMPPLPGVSVGGSFYRLDVLFNHRISRLLAETRSGAAHDLPGAGYGRIGISDPAFIPKWPVVRIFTYRSSICPEISSGYFFAAPCSFSGPTLPLHSSGAIGACFPIRPASDACCITCS